MRMVNYKVLFLSKIIIWCVAIGAILWYAQIPQKDVGGSVIFLVDAQESMNTKDIKKYGELPHTRQAAVSKYILDVIQNIDMQIPVWVVRLGLYPDYIVPPTTDRDMLTTYITSLAASPLSSEIVYETWDVFFGDYISDKNYYILVSDKESTVRDVQSYSNNIYTVFASPEEPDIKVDTTIFDQNNMQDSTFPFYKQSSYLPWIFVLITVVWYMLL